MKQSFVMVTKNFTNRLSSLIILISIFALFFNVQIAYSAQTRKLLFPVSGTWKICQGYNTSELTHTGNMKYSIDLSPDLNSTNTGKFGCYSAAGATSASGRQVVAPAAGTVTQVSTRSDLINFQLDTGGCMQIGHFSSRVSNGHYNQGVNIGTLSGPTALNGNYAHLHLTASSSNCPTFTTPVAFADNGAGDNANFQFYGATNFYATTTLHAWRGNTITQNPVPVTPVNLALNKPASATSQQSSGYLPYQANDGNTGTRWSSQQSPTLGPQWWIVDLGSAQSINQFVISWEAAYARDYFIGYANPSAGKSCWSVTYYGFNRYPTSPRVDTISFATTTARCVAVYMRQRAPGMWNYSIYEVEVYKR